MYIVIYKFGIYEQEDEDEEKPVIGFWSAFTWLVGMTVIIAMLSEYVVGTIEVYICMYIYNKI